MKRKINDVHALLVSAWSRVISKGDAVYVADAVIYAALAKDKRMNPVREAIADLDHSIKQPPRYTATINRGSCQVFDFEGTSPFGLMKKIHDHLRDTAKQYGSASIALRNTSGIHQLSTWIEPLCTTSDLVALFVWNGGSYTVAPFGSKEPFLGTNPIAYGIPTLEKPIVCDMSTSEIPFLSLMTAINRGGDLPFDAGLNSEGKTTRIAKEIFDIDNDGPVRLLPMGKGYKGSALMLFIEIITGALIGAKMGRQATDARFVPEEFGGWLMVWDISVFGDPTIFKTSVSTLARQIRESAKADSYDVIHLPGDRSWDAYDNAMRSENMELDDDDHSRLEKLASGIA